MEDSIYYVYEWIRLDTNEPFYVGMGHKNRWRDFQSRNKWFTNIVNKIPCVVNILEDNISRDVALDLECWYINEYKYVIGYDLCNITDGGDACVLVGEKNAMYGRPWWDENTPQEKIDTWRVNHKKGHEHFKGEGNPFYGKKHTEENLRKISESSRNIDRSFSYKKVILLNTLEEFDSITNASNELGIDRSSIRECCKNKIKTTIDNNDNHLSWSYYDDFINMTEDDIKIKLIIAKNNIRKNDKAVICLTTKRFFTSISKAEKYYSLSINCGIDKCCNKNNKHYNSAGKLKDGTLLIWRYVIWEHNKIYRVVGSIKDVYNPNLNNYSYYLNKINNKKYHNKKIICITTKMIFNSLKDGAKYYNISDSGITSCCKGRLKTSGKLEDGTKLVWRYLIVDHNKILRGKDIFKLHN